MLQKAGIYATAALLVMCLFKPVTVNAQSNALSKVWVADQGNGTYKNPILYADYSDPDAIRVGNDYYLTASSFNCIPGLPILHSKDLVNWKLINYALKQQIPADVFSIPQHGKGVWAPCIRYHNNEFYIYYPDPDFGIYVIKTKDPAGEWSKPVLVLPGKGYIDPTPLWDDDGKVYLAIGWAGSRAGIKSILSVFRLNAPGTKTIDEGRHVFDGHENHSTIEGPKFYKRNGYYYLFAPAGGVVNGWQLVMRSKSVYGPYEARVVMDQGKTTTNGPHQGAWVDTQTGESWFLHFQDRGAYGRILHLQPMRWINNWPVIGVDADGDGKGEPVLTYKKPNVGGETYPITTPPEGDEFNADSIGLQWQWHANPQLKWSALVRGSNFLRLFTYPTEKGAVNLWNAPNLLLQKLPAPNFTATTKVKYAVEDNRWKDRKAGLIMMGSDYSYLSITKDDKGYKVSQVICKNALDGKEEEVVDEKSIGSSTAYLRVQVIGPDARCVFSYSEDGQKFTPIGKEFMAKPDKWIGAKVGIFCTNKADNGIGGYADFDWFRVDK